MPGGWLKPSLRGGNVRLARPGASLDPHVERPMETAIALVKQTGLARTNPPRLAIAVNPLKPGEGIKTSVSRLSVSFIGKNFHHIKFLFCRKFSGQLEYYHLNKIKIYRHQLPE